MTDRTTWRERKGALAVCAVAGIVLASLAGMASGGRTGPVDPAGYTARHLLADLTLPCRVTGCDPGPLAALYGAGLDAMDDAALAEAEALALRIAEDSAAAARAASQGDARVHAKLAAQAAADAAVARLHVAERLRRTSVAG